LRAHAALSTVVVFDCQMADLRPQANAASSLLGEPATATPRARSAVQRPKEFTHL